MGQGGQSGLTFSLNCVHYYCRRSLIADAKSVFLAFAVFDYTGLMSSDKSRSVEGRVA